MTAGELARTLLEYGASAEIMVTWEGIFRDVHVDNVYHAPNGVTVIDADENCYKQEILEGERVPR